MLTIPRELYGSLGPIMAIVFILIGIILTTTVQLLVLRLAMVFPPVRHLVRWIINSARE